MYKRANICAHRLKAEGGRDLASRLINAWRLPSKMPQVRTTGMHNEPSSVQT